MKEGVLDEAILLTNQATEEAPEFYLGWYNLGLMYRRSGALDEAYNSYLRAISLQNDHAESHQNLGLVLLLLGDIINARNSFRNAIKYFSLQNRHHEADNLREQISGLVKLEEDQP